MLSLRNTGGFAILALIGLLGIGLLGVGFLVFSNIALTTTPSVDVDYDQDDLASAQSVLDQLSNVSPDELADINTSVSGNEASALINDYLAGQDIPAENIKLDFVEDKFVASAELDLGFISGPTYLEGKLVDQDGTIPEFDLERVVVNNIELKGAALDYAEGAIKELIDDQLNNLPSEVDLSTIDLSIIDGQLILNDVVPPTEE